MFLKKFFFVILLSAFIGNISLYLEKNYAYGDSDYLHDDSIMSDDPFAESNSTQKIRDPWEMYNRKIWNFNKLMHHYVMQPTVKVYHGIMFHQNLRKSVSNVLRNLDEPLYMMNSLLQGEFHDFAYSLSRFMLNTTFGIFGIFDFAGNHNAVRKKNSFSDTLIKWGACDCNYIILPFFGPYTATRAIGFGIDVISYPIDFALNTKDTYRLMAMNAIDTMNNKSDEMNGIKDESYIDDYLVFRSMYMQKISNRTTKNCSYHK